MNAETNPVPVCENGVWRVPVVVDLQTVVYRNATPDEIAELEPPVVAAPKPAVKKAIKKVAKGKRS